MGGEQHETKSYHGVDGMRLRRRETHTYTTYFDTDQVHELVGGAYNALASDWERRRQYVDKDIQRAVDARLEALRNVWLLMLERAP
jgi:hypothetical protein